MGDYMNINTHSISVIDRNIVNISGVNKVENFDKQEFLLETVMGFLNIKGEMLEMIKLDTIEGNVSIKGNISSIIYYENIKKKKNKEESMMSKLFRWFH